MALEITVGPPRLAINQGYGVLISDQDGQIPWPTDKGFYHSDTRVISAWMIFADGEPWDLLNSGNVAYYALANFPDQPPAAHRDRRGAEGNPRPLASTARSAAASTRTSTWSTTV